ncbi:alpha/beta hydrolase [Cellulophaga baltica]|uniref:alpha/beta hydrolase n=1 Tax=Cellulophaga TaxID=104264 RepID=UPI001C07320A|nr:MULTISPECIES: alpha/beta hydrolase [Cellulophaga]MBU2996895.1 alpha/beta hydrolase [Cellulophaga baltica]MDO6768293.1 alpha/beta hydrolase [Cellulophaga sp. 1_MG-2023]
MRNLFFYAFVITSLLSVNAQKLTLKKGVIIDSIIINDTIQESYALFLPSNFDTTKKWPIVFAFDVNGQGSMSLKKLRQGAEKNGYILAATNNVFDSISLTKNILVTSRMMNNVFSILPIHQKRIYVAGFDYGARYASILPIVIKNLNGVISFEEPISNSDVLNPNKPFHYIGVSSIENFNLQEMQLTEKSLNKLRFSNQLYVYDKQSLNVFNIIDKAFESFTLSAMAKGVIAKDSIFINETYNTNLSQINKLVEKKKLLAAFDLMMIVEEIYRPLKEVEDLKSKYKTLKKEKTYKALKRTETNTYFKEVLLREDFDYAIYEDVLTYNFNNLGWWKYQSEEIEKFIADNDAQVSNMGKRLSGFVDYLVDSNLKTLNGEENLDEEGLLFLWMLNTIIHPNDFQAYKNIISYSAKHEDYDTALFYLEELLKAGYKNKESLYTIENTALLKITPEYNVLINKYLKGARYEVIEQ